MVQRVNFERNLKNIRPATVVTTNYYSVVQIIMGHGIQKLFKDYRPHLIKKILGDTCVAFLTDFNLLGYTKLVKIITNNVIKPNFNGLLFSGLHQGAQV